VDVTGLDVGIVNHATGNFGGLQWGLVGYVEKDGVGWQDNAVNITKGKFTGFQYGWLNQDGEGNGFLVGLVNVT
jgi:hypothetical protein